jgi:hypothetical protein
MAKSLLIWCAVALVLLVPLVVAAQSPYLAYRDPTYIVAGFVGILSLILFLLQPLLAGGHIPGLRPRTSRIRHRAIGSVITLAVVAHVGGLYLTSPPDTLDALLLVSPTPFSFYGVVALWGMIITAILVLMRRRLPFRFLHWVVLHNVLAVLIVISTVVHALLIEGTMGTASIWVTCLTVMAATLWVVWDMRVMRQRRKH